MPKRNSLIKIEEGLDGRDGLSRTATVKYEEKILTIPNYCPLITKSPNIDELDIRLRVQGHTKGHVGSYVMKLFDVDRILLDKVKKVGQLTMDGEYESPVFRNFFKHNLFILDPSSESLDYSKHRSKLMHKRYPQVVRDFVFKLLEMKEKGKLNTQTEAKEIASFWDSLTSDKRRLNRFLANHFDQTNETTADIILPFTIVIESKYTFEIAKAINEMWRVLCEINRKPTVAYFLMKKAVLRNAPLMNEIIEYLKSLDVEVIVIKIKNLDLTNGNDVEPRELYTDLLQAIALIKAKNKQVLTVALECGDQLFPNAIRAFDIVSRSMSGYDTEREATGGASVPVYGGALDEDDMVSLPFEKWQKGFNVTNSMPCSHDYCHDHITTLDKSVYPDTLWNTDRRIHNMLTMDEWMYQIAQAVINKQADMTYLKIHNSQLRILEELIPRNGKRM